jgi:hypothetical protein
VEKQYSALDARSSFAHRSDAYCFCWRCKELRDLEAAAKEQDSLWAVDASEPF